MLPSERRRRLSPSSKAAGCSVSARVRGRIESQDRADAEALLEKDTRRYHRKSPRSYRVGAICEKVGGRGGMALFSCGQLSLDPPIGRPCSVGSGKLGVNGGVEARFGLGSRLAGAVVSVRPAAAPSSRRAGVGEQRPCRSRVVRSLRPAAEEPEGGRRPPGRPAATANAGEDPNELFARTG